MFKLHTEVNSNEFCLQEGSHNDNSNTGDIGDKPSKSLTEAAREYEEARAVKRKYEQVTIVTGEEDEANVLQVNVKASATYLLDQQVT